MAVIRAQQSTSFRLLDCKEGSWTCRGITIYFPPSNQSVPVNKIIGADFGLVGYLKPLEFHAPNGWKDINVTTDPSFSFSDYHIGTMHCITSDNQSAACNFSVNAWACANADDICNDPYRTVPPSTSPTSDTNAPSLQPTKAPVLPPTTSPTRSTLFPTIPSMNPTESPVVPPTASPTHFPSWQPTRDPTHPPTRSPTNRPSIHPTISTTNPTVPSSPPSITPTDTPTQTPTNHPTTATKTPTLPTVVPTQTPTESPTNNPSAPPTIPPTLHPTIAPTVSTVAPSRHPSLPPTHDPTIAPSNNPTLYPTNLPTALSDAPSHSPSLKPTNDPTVSPSHYPSLSPTHHPSSTTSDPTLPPSTQPSDQPSSVPSAHPTTIPSLSPILMASTSAITTESICSMSCEDAAHPMQVKVAFWFQSHIIYDLSNIECFLYPIFVEWLTEYEFMHSFEPCDIHIIFVDGGKEDSTSCADPPCIDRLWLTQTDGNTTMTVITSDSDTTHVLETMSLHTAEQEFQTQYLQRFAIAMTVHMNIEQQNQVHLWSDMNPLWYIFIGLIVVLCCIGCILVYQCAQTRKRKTEAARPQTEGTHTTVPRHLQSGNVSQSNETDHDINYGRHADAGKPSDAKRKASEPSMELCANPIHRSLQPWAKHEANEEAGGMSIETGQDAQADPVLINMIIGGGGSGAAHPNLVTDTPSSQSHLPDLPAATESFPSFRPQQQPHYVMHAPMNANIPWSGPGPGPDNTHNSDHRYMHQDSRQPHLQNRSPLDGHPSNNNYGNGYDQNYYNNNNNNQYNNQQRSGDGMRNCAL